jgi:hypothetical protein
VSLGVSSLQRREEMSRRRDMVARGENGDNDDDDDDEQGYFEDRVTCDQVEIYLYNETLRHSPFDGQEQPINKRTAPKSHRSSKTLSPSPALYDGLKVLDSLQSCKTRRASHRRDAFKRLLLWVSQHC